MKLALGAWFSNEKNYTGLLPPQILDRKKMSASKQNWRTPPPPPCVFRHGFLRSVFTHHRNDHQKKIKLNKQIQWSATKPIFGKRLLPTKMAGFLWIFSPDFLRIFCVSTHDRYMDQMSCRWVKLASFKKKIKNKDCLFVLLNSITSSYFKMMPIKSKASQSLMTFHEIADRRWVTDAPATGRSVENPDLDEDEEATQRDFSRRAHLDEPYVSCRSASIRQTMTASHGHGDSRCQAKLGSSREGHAPDAAAKINRRLRQPRQTPRGNWARGSTKRMCEAVP